MAHLHPPGRGEVRELHDLYVLCIRQRKGKIDMATIYDRTDIYDLFETGLEKLGYRDIQVLAFPVQLGSFHMDQTDWYCMIAKKP